MTRSTDAGKMVTCIELLSDGQRAALGILDSNGPVWRIDRDCSWNNGGKDERLPYAPDAALMPIRPEPDPLDDALPDASDIEGFHKLVASGALGDFMDRIVKGAGA